MAHIPKVTHMRTTDDTDDFPELKRHHSLPEEPENSLTLKNDGDDASDDTISDDPERYISLSPKSLTTIINDIKDPGDLPNAKPGEVCLRFSISPSTPLDIQFARAAILHDFYAKKYQGRLIIRIDDTRKCSTNVMKCNSMFVGRLLKDLKTLGINYDTVSYTSDYFPQLMAKAESLILQGKAYVDHTTRERMQREEKDGIESKCRNLKPKENMALWKEMIAGSDVGRECYLRGKLDMQDPDKHLRDPVYYSCNPVEHYRTGTRFKLYPKYVFSCPFLDATDAISHATSSYYNYDSFPLYYRVLQDMGFCRIETFRFKLLKMAYTPLTHQLCWFVENNIVNGWGDPSLPTVRGLVRRGVRIEALRQFVYEQGVSKDKHIEWGTLWTINDVEILKQVSHMHTAVLEQNHVLLRLENVPDELDKKSTWLENASAQKMFENCLENVGKCSKIVTYSKDIWLENADASSFSVGEEISLMDWNTAKIDSVEKGEDGSVTKLTGYLTGVLASNSSLKPKLWLPVTDEPVRLLLVKFNNLVTKKKVKVKEDMHDVHESCRIEVKHAFGDFKMRNLEPGDILLLDSKGFFRCDVPFVRPSEPMVLFLIPGGANLGRIF